MSMDSFATRSALVAVWVTIGSLGVVSLVTGGLNIYGSTVVRTATGGAYGMSNAMITSGIVMVLIGMLITGFCGWRIYKDLTRPMAPGKNARAETPLLRFFAILAFSVGTIVGCYGLYKQGVPMMGQVHELITLESTQAKVLTIDSILGENDAKSGTFAYYAGGKLSQRFGGRYENKFPNQHLKPGRTFTITYDKKKPSEYYLDRPRSSPLYLFPEILALLIIFWMVSAGITGVKANMSKFEDGDDTPDKDYDRNYKFNRTSPNIRNQSGFGQTKDTNGFGKFRGVK